MRSDIRIAVRTAAPRWLFDVTCRASIDLQPCDADVGMVQLDSLTIDQEATARRAADFYSDFDARVDREASWLLTEGVALVVGDIPPLAFAAAARAGVSSIASGNFTWDWIYEDYAVFDRLAPDVLPIIREAYATATVALRLPFHGGFAPMAERVRDIPLVAHVSSRDPADTRRALGILDGRPAVLASFTGYGAPLAYGQAVRDRKLWVVTTTGDRALDATTASAPNLIALDAAASYAHGIRYEDVIAAVDAVLSKPGYGVVSECAANETALLYTSRGKFREQDVFVAEMPRYLRVRSLAQEAALAGHWTDAVEALLAQPAPPERLPSNGSTVAADAILRLSGS
jgi:hypothetical protein